MDDEGFVIGEPEEVAQPSSAGLEGRPRYFASSDESTLLEIERGFVLEGETRRSRGLSFSGGGIRSAAFSMGVLQGLVAGNRLAEFDYLSTVSGGGYTGTSLTYFLHEGLPKAEGASAGTSPADFPFGTRDPGAPNAKVQAAILNFIRQQASYLCPTPRLGILSAIAVVIRASFLSLLVYGTILTGCLGILLGGGYFEPRNDIARMLGVEGMNVTFAGLAPFAVLGFLAALAIGYIVLIWIQRFAWVRRALDDAGGYRTRTLVQTTLGSVVIVLVLLAIPALLSLLYIKLQTFRSLGLGGFVTTIIGSFLGFADRANERSQTTKVTKLRVLIGATLATTGLLVASFFLADRLRLCPFGLLPSACGLLGVGLFLGLVGNENYLGLHRMYRDRLMELFTPDPVAIRTMRWNPATTSDGLGIHRVCGVGEGRVKRPYHLINTNVVLINSEEGRARGRGGDSFVLSPLYVGSNATGWVRSDRYMNAERGGRGMTLPSAMSISGAALNPNTGVSGRGLTRTLLLSFLLALSNLRLGYWAPNPKSKRSAEPNFLRPGLLTLFGKGYSGNEANVELTDGGHFENLGLYELVRRRAEYVLAIDAGEDGLFQFGDLANAVERVRVDFGARIEFDPLCPLADLLPGSAGSEGCGLVGIERCAKRPFAIAEIRYADGTRGKLVYLKSTLFAGLPIDVLGYYKEQPEFPHQKTTDQFFDEAQFEAYRELGYYAAWKMIEHEEKSPPV